MTEENKEQISNGEITEEPIKKSPKKRVMLSIIIGLVAIAGIASAYFLIKKTPKEQYFLAEIKTASQIKNLFENRYEDEIEWNNKKKDSVTESTYEISANYDDSYEQSLDWSQQELLNNSAIKLKVELDPKKKVVGTELDADVMGIPIDGVKGYVTPKQLIVSLPFHDKKLQLKDKDFGHLMRIFDENYNGNEELGLSEIMGKDGILSEENIEYINKEYLMDFYKSIPEDAFKVQEETVSIHNQKMKTDKITMDLTEKEVKTLLTDLLKKAKDDPKLYEMIKDTVGSIMWYEEGISKKELSANLDESIDGMIDEVENLDISKGIKSTIWSSKKGIIVKRKFEMQVDNSSAIVEGTQLLDDEKQKWGYKIGNPQSEEYLVFKGNLSFEDGKVLDKITLKAESQTGFTYTGEESLNKNKREFERTISLNDGMDDFTVTWNGDANFENDSMTADHTFNINADNISGGVNITETGKVIKKVNLPDTSVDTVNLGEMEKDELLDYWQNTLLPDIQYWGTDIGEQLNSIDE